MGKLNKKQLYANWVCAQYPPNRKSTKINAKYNFVFKLYEKDIDLTKYKTNSKKAILWEHFLHLLKTGNISIENVPAQVHEVSYSKTRKKL